MSVPVLWTIKPGVDMRVSPLLLGILPIIGAAARLVLGRPAVITSGYREGDPRYHGRGLAFDIRTNDVSEAKGEEFARALRLLLGLGFDVLQHGDGANRHVHLELDSRKFAAATALALGVILLMRG